MEVLEIRMIMNRMKTFCFFKIIVINPVHIQQSLQSEEPDRIDGEDFER